MCETHSTLISIACHRKIEKNKNSTRRDEKNVGKFFNIFVQSLYFWLIAFRFRKFSIWRIHWAFFLFGNFLDSVGAIFTFFACIHMKIFDACIHTLEEMWMQKSVFYALSYWLENQMDGMNVNSRGDLNLAISNSNVNARRLWTTTKNRKWKMLTRFVSSTRTNI